MSHRRECERSARDNANKKWQGSQLHGSVGFQKASVFMVRSFRLRFTLQ